MFISITTEDYEYAQQHQREQVVTARCLECGYNLIFKIVSRTDHLDILIQAHNCEESPCTAVNQ